MAAILNEVGTIPEVSNEWMIATIKGNREGRQALTKAKGRWSNWQVEDLDLWKVQI